MINSVLRLVQLLQELSSLLVNMQKGAQIAIAAPLRIAIWNWIEYHQEEFNDALRYHRRLEGAPERVRKSCPKPAMPMESRLGFMSKGKKGRRRGGNEGHDRRGESNDD